MKRLTATVAILLCFCQSALADPAPFGLEIGRTSIGEAKEAYRLESTGINQYSRGEMFRVPPSQITFEGLQDVTLIFDREATLAAVIATLNKSRFDDVLAGLRQRYRSVSSEIPFVGNKSAKLVDGDTEIHLEAPHLSFQMTMSYLRKDFLQAYRQQSQEEERRQRQQEMNQL